MIYGLKIRVEETLFLAAAGTISSLFQMATAHLTDETTRLTRGFWEIKLKWHVIREANTNRTCSLFVASSKCWKSKMTKREPCPRVSLSSRRSLHESLVLSRQHCKRQHNAGPRANLGEGVGGHTSSPSGTMTAQSRGRIGSKAVWRWADQDRGRPSARAGGGGLSQALTMGEPRGGPDNLCDVES